MRIDLDKYSINKEFIQRWYLESGEPTGYAVAMMAQATLVPCIVVAYYIGEVSGWTPELLRHIEVLKTFYGYTEIVNKPAGAP